MGQYNPSAPLMVGNEFAPVLQANYRPDLFVERGYSFRHDDSEILDGWVSMFVDKLPAWAVPGHAYLWTLYRRGQEVSTGPMKVLDFDFLAVQSFTNALDQDGAAPGANDISFQTDGNYIRFRTGGTGESYIRLVTDSDAANQFEELQGKRIVDVSIMYTASAEPGNDDPVPLEINHYNICSSQRIPYGNATVALRESLISDVQRSRWGEIATWAWTGNNLTESTARYPWNYSLMNNFNRFNDRWAVEFRTASAPQDAPREIRLHHARMRVTYCEENRLAVAGVVLGSGYINADIPTLEPFSGYLRGRNFPNSFGVGMIDPQSLNFDCTVPSGSFSAGNTQVRDLTLTLKRADYGAYNNQGPLPELRALRTVDIFPGHPGVVINNTVEAGQTNTISSTDLIPQIVLHGEPDGAEDDWEAPAVPFIHPYGVQEPLPVFNGQAVVQEIVETSNGTDVPYPQLRFWARHNAATAALEISIETSEQGPVTVAYLSTSDWEALPEVADGWRQVTIDVDPALLIDDDGGVLTPGAPRWESDTSEFQAWEILATRVRREGWDSAISMPYNLADPSRTGQATYGDEAAQGGIEGSFPNSDDIDVSVIWGQALPTIEGLAVELAVQPLAQVDPECPVPPTCIADGLYYLSVTWVPQDAGYGFVGLGHYELQRQDDTMDANEWEVVARPIHPLVDQFDDYEVRVDVETRYRIRYVHQNGMFGAWSTAASGEVPAPGVTGVQTDKGVLIFSSNVDPDHNLAYVQIWNGGPNEDFTFVEASTRDLQRMYGRDYQVAFRPLERGGVQFTRTLLVNAVQVPVETLREGFTSLRDMAWADIPYVCVRSDRGDRWLSNVNVPSGNIRNRRKLYVAEIEVTEVADEPYAPEPTFCEGMTARGSLPSTIYEPRFATTPATASLDSDDLSIRVQIRLDQEEQYIPLVTRFDPVNNFGDGWYFEYNDGVLKFFLGTNPGPGEAEFTSDPVPFLPGDLYWVRIDYDMNGGGTTSTGQFYTSTDGVTWNPLATTTVQNDPVSASAGSEYPLVVGATFDGTSDWVAAFSTGGSGGWNGVILQAQVYDLDATATQGLQLSGNSGSYASTPDAAVHDIAGDIEMSAVIRPDSWTPASDKMIVSKYAVSGSQRAYEFGLGSTTNLFAVISPDGSATTVYVSSVPPTPLPDGSLAVKVEIDLDNGGGNSVATFYTAPDRTGPWTPLGVPQLHPVVASLFNSNQPLIVSGRDGGVAALFEGSIDWVEVRDGIGGTVTANPDFTAQPTDTTSFVDAAGNTWTINGDARIVNDPASSQLLADPDFSVQDGDTVEFTDSEGNQWNVANGVCTVDRRL